MQAATATSEKNSNVLGGGFKYFSLSTLLGEGLHFVKDFQRGWNHQLE